MRRLIFTSYVAIFQSPSLQFAFLCNYIANCDTILSYIFVFVTLALYGSSLLLRFYLISSSHIIIFIVKHTHLYLTLCGSLHLICLASLWACSFAFKLFLKNNDHHKRPRPINFISSSPITTTTALLLLHICPSIHYSIRFEALSTRKGYAN